ncbi:KinB-signaling pathway activation protein [Salinicoccus carnicancri]|uniref:KinB-signaling pathway activation protein n=1 Tax=Salinicoccus carnicancri TaxID=558170 RepID=UPI0002D448BB|nr:KinB-signaling pathway activation protein [Salinicoccus carnicancri]
MTSKYLVKFYFRTLLLGMIITAAVSLITEYQNVTRYLFEGQIGEFLAGLVWFLGYGLLIATVSQVAFFIYLFLHPLGMGIFGRIWPYVQLLLVMYAIFDLFYLRFYRFGLESGQVWSFIWIPVLVVAAGFIVAGMKNKYSEGTNIFIPALFYMIFMTSITLIPFLSVEDTSWIYRSVFTLIICNAAQLLTLPSYIEASEKEKEERGRVTKSDINEQKRAELKHQEAAQKKKEESQTKKRKNMKYKNETRMAENRKKKKK